MKTNITVKIKTAAKSTKKKKKLCDLLLQAELHNEFGSFIHWVKDPEKIKFIAMAFVDDHPIGVTIIGWERNNYNAGVYVHESYRREGIGSQLLQRSKKHAKKKRFKLWLQERHFPEFFKRNGF